ncbi:Retrovirus-related Pol polyprotein from transposon TNT 1-94 [Eumeta japonica]|uniref:Retrovirus-related Pol polyprotein from transposon TNT 1-94 n=1 Tax=Eumeta variegata TaxID=151549 RepID=A0A4C1SZK5_EUMVA|nr:Retrovirus-related Pol polyprotein from transposon TNT 1-94 [Eumeta japonica]
MRCQGKQSRLPINHVGTRSSEVLNIIHADVCGSMEAKNQVFKYFWGFKSLVENQQNEKIKTFRSDNGLEFCNPLLDSCLAEAGLVHEKTNTYTPEQNAISERLNRTLMPD